VDVELVSVLMNQFILSPMKKREKEFRNIRSTLSSTESKIGHSKSNSIHVETLL
jgi:hypothetical protein